MNFKKERTMYNPVRMCTACRGRFSKKKLIRLAKIKNGKTKMVSIRLDLKQKLEGRGFYVCYSDDCLKKLKKNINKKKVFFGNINENLLEEIERAIEAFEA